MHVDMYRLYSSIKSSYIVDNKPTLPSKKHSPTDVNKINQQFLVLNHYCVIYSNVLIACQLDPGARHHPSWIYT